MLLQPIATRCGCFILFAFSIKKKIRILDVESNRWRVATGHSDFVLCMDSYRKTDHMLLASGAKDQTIRLWEDDGTSLSCIGLATGHTDAVGAVAFGKKSPLLI